MNNMELKKFFLDHNVTDGNKEIAESVCRENDFIKNTLRPRLSEYRQIHRNRIDLHINQQFDKAPNKRGSKKFIQKFHESTHFFETDGVFVSYMVLFGKNHEDFATTDFVLTPIKTDRGLLYAIFKSTGSFHASFNIVIHSHVFDRMVNRGCYLNRKDAIREFMMAMINMKMFPKEFKNNRNSFDNDTVVLGLNGDAILGNYIDGINYMKTFITKEMFGTYQKADFVDVHDLNIEFNESFQNAKQQIITKRIDGNCQQDVIRVLF